MLALLGSRVPASLKVFLTALAILDDLGAVAIIALFYTGDLSLPMLAARRGLRLALLVGLNRAGVTRLSPYLAIGRRALVLRAPLGGPRHPRRRRARARRSRSTPTPGGRRRRIRRCTASSTRLHPWVAFLIVPVFGFANAGVSFAGLGLDALLAPVPLGIALGLFVGKQLGVYAFAFARRPRSASPTSRPARPRLQCYGVALLCGIGFTMSLFIGALAFPASPELNDATKIGVLAGSVLSALARLCGPAAGAPRGGATASR